MNIGEVVNLKIKKRRFFEINEHFEYTMDKECYLCEVQDIINANVTNEKNIEVEYLVKVLNKKPVWKLNY